MKNDQRFLKIEPPKYMAARKTDHISISPQIDAIRESFGSIDIGGNRIYVLTDEGSLMRVAIGQSKSC